MYITSYGAAEGVTGSCHLLEVGSSRVLLDCGIFQGRGTREKNEPPFPFDPSAIDHVIVSHAHLDHIGRLPLLFKEGFRGKVWSTRATYELARLSLLDSASVLDHDARQRNRNRAEGEPKIVPIYDEEDVLDLVELWKPALYYDEQTVITAGVSVIPHDAGHILGSSFLQFELREGPELVRFTFSGDLGNINKPIIGDPKPGVPSDIVMLESTYGNRNHRPFSESVSELETAIRETFARGGNVVIPSFALERAQELLYVLYEGWRGGRIPDTARIFLDSPMAISATRIFERHTDLFDADALALHAQGGDPFDFDALRYTRATRDSMEINHLRKNAIILAGSGMVTGGRVIHHLRHNLLRSECSVVFIGFQAEGTTGRQIINGAKFATLHGQSIPVEAQIYTVNGFSGHAGQSALTDWAKQSQANKVLLVHGEQDVKQEFRTHLQQATDARSIDIMPFGERRDLIAMRGG